MSQQSLSCSAKSWSMPCRYKKAFQQPGAPTAAINYYRALIDCATWCAALHGPSMAIASALLHTDLRALLGNAVTHMEYETAQECPEWHRIIPTDRGSQGEAL